MSAEDKERDSVRQSDEVDWFFENASPNPDRIGCPSNEVLVALARKMRPITDPGYDHLGQCSPCYKQFRHLQKQNSERRPNWRLAVAAAVALVVAGAAIYIWSGRTHRPLEIDPTPASTASAATAVLDLRRFLVTRGEPQSPVRQPLQLPRTDVRLNILLPVGFEAGQYDLRLVDSSLSTVLRHGVSAAMENQIATIQTSVDLSALPSGQYQLALRRPGEDWQFFPTILK